MRGKNEEYKCEKCDFSTNRKSKLQGHICILSNKHRDTQKHKKTFKCKVCEEKLTTKGIMKRHLHDRHSGGRPFDCLICSKSFKQKNHLKRHMNSSRCLRDKNNMDQNGKRLFSCEVCGKKSKKRSNLERHMRVHDGKRPYDCKKCYKSFKYPGCLKDHMISWHSSDKQFHCEKCLKPFRKKSSLKEHLRWRHRSKEGNEKPRTTESEEAKKEVVPQYKCDLCNFTMDRQVNLEAHMLVRHSI